MIAALGTLAVLVAALGVIRARRDFAAQHAAFVERYKDIP